MFRTLRNISFAALNQISYVGKQKIDALQKANVFKKRYFYLEDTDKFILDKVKFAVLSTSVAGGTLVWIKYFIDCAKEPTDARKPLEKNPDDLKDIVISFNVENQLGTSKPSIEDANKKSDQSFEIPFKLLITEAADQKLPVIFESVSDNLKISIIIKTEPSENCSN